MEDYNYYENNACRYEYISLSEYVNRTFLWMFLGLMLTFAVAYYGYASAMILYIFYHPGIYCALLIGEVIAVMYLSARIEQMSFTTAKVLFVIYAVINGISLSSLFLTFNAGSLIYAFGLTSMFFGIMALYGFTTKRDLSGTRSLLCGGLIFLLLVSLLSIFFNFGVYETTVCVIGIIVFLGLTAYDMQKVKYYHNAFAYDPEMAAKSSIYAALQIYLDFINIFMYILRFMRNKRD